MYEAFETTGTTSGTEVSKSESSEYSISVGVEFTVKTPATESKLSVNVGYSTTSEVSNTVSN